MSQAENNKSIYRLFVDEVIIKGNIDAVDDMVADDFIDHGYFSDEIPPDREGLKRGIRMCRDCLPDLKVEIHDVTAQGDKIIARTTWRGRHGRDAAEPAGARPAGESAGACPVEFETLNIARYDNGKLVEHWGLTDDGPGRPTARYLPEQAAP